MLLALVFGWIYSYMWASKIYDKQAIDTKTFKMCFHVTDCTRNVIYEMVINICSSSFPFYHRLNTFSFSFFFLLDFCSFSHLFITFHSVLRYLHIRDGFIRLFIYVLDLDGLNGIVA